MKILSLDHFFSFSLLGELGETRIAKVYSSSSTPTTKSENPPVLRHKLELEALIPGFGSTDGTYILTKDERNRSTHIRDPPLSVFG